MNGEGEGLLAWSIDLCAASLLGSAVWFCGASAGEPMLGIRAGCLAALLGFVTLRRVPVDPTRVALAPFGQLAWEAALAPDEPCAVEPLLLLDDPLPTLPADSGVVRLLPAPRTLPTAGDLKRRIDAHLQARSSEAKVISLPADARAALRTALAELKQSLR